MRFEEKIVKHAALTSRKPPNKPTIVVIASTIPKITQSSPRKSKATILTTQQRQQAQRILDKPITYIPDPIFTQPDAERVLFHDAIQIPKADSSWYIPTLQRMETSTSTTHKSINSQILNFQQERALFLQFNYARYRVATIQIELSASENHITYNKARQLIHWHDLSKQLEDQITQYNLALVLAMIARFRTSGLDFSELVSEGNMALLRSINKFNGSTGYKFSTYACRAIIRAFYHVAIDHGKQIKLFPAEFDLDYQYTTCIDDYRELHELECTQHLLEIVSWNTADLTPAERDVIRYRFGVNQTPNAQPLTLDKVGKLVGLTRERVRQIQNRAIRKIKLALETSYIFCRDYSRQDAIAQAG